MENPVLNLAAINTISEPLNAIIVDTIDKNKRSSFKELQNKTKLSNDKLRKQLEKLQKYCIIKGEVTSPDNGSYSFYHLTKLGKELHEVLLDSLVKSSDIHPEPISDRFVIDSTAFKNILNKVHLDSLKQIFDHSKIVLTDHDYSELKELSYEHDDTSLEDFLNNEEQVIICSTYDDVQSSTKIEYYLKRIKKLSSSYETRLIVSAIDTKSSLITDNEKIQTAARSLGVMCSNSDAVFELQKEDYLWEKFYELSLKQSDAKNTNFVIPNDPIIALKKNN